MTDARIVALMVGRIAPLGPRGVASGIDKRPADGTLHLATEGLSGDAQGDRKRHGGPEKALHHYPQEHYAAWRRDSPELAPRLASPGAFGENLATFGVTEDEVCIGDIFRLGDARVQLSQGRQPCWKLNDRFGQPDMARRVQETRRTGWYYRVLTPGPVSANSSLVLEDRPHPDWPLDRVLRVFQAGVRERAALAAIAELPTLAASWRELAVRRLRRGQVEDQAKRLGGPRTTGAESP